MTPYLIVGDGRLATHFKHYFTLSNIPFLSWSRNEASDEKFYALAQKSPRILLLINDASIEPFIKTHPGLENKIWIHCSGSLNSTLAQSAHPLCTFGETLYTLETYRKIPFITEEHGTPFSILLPDLKNKHFAISHDKKAMYHSFCVMAGNFTTILWQNAFRQFEDKIGLPKEVLFPYLQQTVQNLISNPDAALTGPISRGDTQTILRNLDSLQNLPEQSLYYAFLNFTMSQNKTGVTTNEYPRL